jgi:serine/threonine protein kinase
MINDKYEIINIINNGNYGKVYKVKYNNIFYALKEETNDDNILLNEANIYKELRFIKNVGKMKDYFRLNNKSYLVLNLYDKNLVQIKFEKYNSINYITLLNNIFKIIFKTFENIHNNSFLHRDIKPSNICLDVNNNPFIIDFGFSKKYIINNQHIKEKKINSIIGSYSFISKNVYNLIEPSRRDDIESLIYVYIYMIISKDHEKYIINLKMNNNIYIKNLLTLSNIELKIVNNVIEILDYIKTLKFETQPNYTYILNLLIN